MFKKLLSRSKTLVFVHVDAEQSIVDTKSLKSDCVLRHLVDFCVLKC